MKKIIITLSCLVIAGAAITLGYNYVNQDTKPEPPTAEIEGDNGVATESKIELNSKDEGFVNESEEVGVRIRDNEFIIGVPNSGNVQMWHIEPTDEVNVYTMVDIQDRIDNPSPEAMNDYVKVEDAYPNGLSFKVISPEEIEVYHGAELIDNFISMPHGISR